MDCISSPLSEDQLLAALSDVADEVVLGHLLQCPGCQSRLKALQQSEYHLKQKLYRWSCPDSLRLSEFALKMLSSDDQNSVASHVKDCPVCQQEIEGLQGFLAQAAKADAEEHKHVSPRPAPHRQPRERAAYPIPGAAAFAMRGDVTRPIEFEKVTLILSTFEEEGSPRLVGQLVGAQAALWKDGLVKVQQGEAQPSLGLINDRAKFECRLKDTSQPIHLTITSKHGYRLIAEAIDLSGG